MTPPIVLVSFNRPELTRHTLDRIREMAPSELFLLVDGPRSMHPEDPARVASVIAELELIDWPCTVHRRYAETNLGIAANIELGLDWVFEHTASAVILEDDCAPDPTFYRYCSELLERYNNDSRVGYIGGATTHLAPELFHGHSYAFTAFGSIWGWATWRRAWHQHRRLFPRDHRGNNAAPIRTAPIDWDSTALVSSMGRRFFQSPSPVADRVVSSWAIHWVLSNLSTGSLAITSAVPLVANLGFGEHGTNTRTKRVLPTAGAMTFPLIHPAEVALNRDLELEMERHIRRELGALARIARRVVPQGRSRVFARRLDQGFAAIGSRLRARRAGRSQG